MPEERHYPQDAPAAIPRLNGNIKRTFGTWRYVFPGCWMIPGNLNRFDFLIDAFAGEFSCVKPLKGPRMPEAQSRC